MRKGFTLIELLISIALVLVLILGINQVFQYTLQAVGAGQSLGTSIRDSRAAQTTFTNDLSSVASTDGPFFIIHSGQVYAFRNRADMGTSKSGDASLLDINGNGKEGEAGVPGEVIGPTHYNFRNHRVDTLQFFAHGQFVSETGNLQFANQNTASSEARIWYGFLRLPDSKYLSPTDPGYNANSYKLMGMARGSSAATNGANPINASSNPNNYFATDWVLGRVATLLIKNPSAGLLAYTPVNPGPPGVWPLDSAATATDANNFKWTGSTCRTDIANTSMADFTTILTTCINTTANPPWWLPLSIGTFGKTISSPFECNPFYQAVALSGLTPAQIAARQQMTPDKMARTVPYFLKGCTQFSVEFAGDFVQQDNDSTSATYGDVVDFVTTSNGKQDGMDYMLIPSTAPRAQWLKRIRWYGLPRNESGAVKIVGNLGAGYIQASKTFTPGTLEATALPDIVPLRDVICTTNGGGGKVNNAMATLTASLAPTTPAPIPQWIERLTPIAAADYSTENLATMTDYTVAWGPDSDNAGIPRPKMIRIRITLDDANSQSTDGQNYEYVFTLPN